MKNAKTSWSDLSIFVCTKCSKEIDPASLKLEGLPAENLKSFLKENLNTMGHKGKVRVMTTSCLGTCPKGQQAVAHISAKNTSNSGVWICHPEVDREHLLTSISDLLSESSNTK